MGREVRMVPKDWQHPKDERGKYKPLFEGDAYAERAKAFIDARTPEQLQDAINYWGSAPDRNDYMPNWTAEERTHYMMYEDTTEGTPISPAFATPEELARWLTDTSASAFGDEPGTYEGWLRVARGGFAPTGVMVDGAWKSGVDMEQP